MDEPIKTGDQVELVIATTGNNCNVIVNGKPIHAYKLMIKAQVGRATKLQIDTYYPWPPRVVDGEPKKRTFKGYFVSTEDWNKFQKRQEEQNNGS